jgi:hypothetical protein
MVMDIEISLTNLKILSFASYITKSFNDLSPIPRNPHTTLTTHALNLQ